MSRPDRYPRPDSMALGEYYPSGQPFSALSLADIATRFRRHFRGSPVRVAAVDPTSTHTRKRYEDMLSAGVILPDDGLRLVVTRQMDKDTFLFGDRLLGLDRALITDWTDVGQRNYSAIGTQDCLIYSGNHDEGGLVFAGLARCSSLTVVGSKNPNMDIITELTHKWHDEQRPIFAEVGEQEYQPIVSL